SGHARIAGGGPALDGGVHASRAKFTIATAAAHRTVAGARRSHTVRLTLDGATGSFLASHVAGFALPVADTIAAHTIDAVPRPAFGVGTTRCALLELRDANAARTEVPRSAVFVDEIGRAHV